MGLRTNGGCQVQKARTVGTRRVRGGVLASSLGFPRGVSFQNRQPTFRSTRRRVLCQKTDTLWNKRKLVSAFQSFSLYLEALLMVISVNCCVNCRRRKDGFGSWFRIMMSSCQKKATLAVEKKGVNLGGQNFNAHEWSLGFLCHCVRQHCFRCGRFPNVVTYIFCGVSTRCSLWWWGALILRHLGHNVRFPCIATARSRYRHWCTSRLAFLRQGLKCSIVACALCSVRNSLDGIASNALWHIRSCFWFISILKLPFLPCHFWAKQCKDGS